MKAILIDICRKVREIEIENTLEALQARVGGDIEAVHLNDDLVAICNEDGKLEELPPVALLVSPDGGIAYDALCGPVVVCRAEDDEFAGIQPGDEKLMRRSLYVLPSMRGVAVG